MIALTTGHIILSQKLIRLYYLPAIFNSRFLSVDLPYDHQLNSKMTMPTCIASLWVKSRKKLQATEGVEKLTEISLKHVWATKWQTTVAITRTAMFYYYFLYLHILSTQSKKDIPKFAKLPQPKAGLEQSWTWNNTVYVYCLELIPVMGFDLCFFANTTASACHSGVRVRGFSGPTKMRKIYIPSLEIIENEIQWRVLWCMHSGELWGLKPSS